MEKAIIVSGYFNPIHKGHLEYFNKTKVLADELFVTVYSGVQRNLKDYRGFQKEEEGLFILQYFKAVDKAVISNDIDRTVCASIRMMNENFGDKYELTFANGGDNNDNSISEAPNWNELNVQLIDGLVDEIQSSSWLLKKRQ